MLAQLAPGGSTTKGTLVVELVADRLPAATASATVPLTFGPPLPDSAASQLGSALEVAASRALAPAGLPHLLAARLSCEPDGLGGLVLHGVAAIPAPILDFKPLLSKRVVPCPLAQQLQNALLGSSAAAPGSADEELQARRGRVQGREHVFLECSHDEKIPSLHGNRQDLLPRRVML